MLKRGIKTYLVKTREALPLQLWRLWHLSQHLDICRARKSIEFSTDNPQRKNALPWSFPTCRPHHVIIRVLYVEERILSIPGTQSDAPILTRAPPGTKLQSNSSFKSQDSSDCTWSSALKRRALKNYIFSNSSAVKAIFRIRQTRVDVIDIHIDKWRICNVPWYILGRP